MNTIKKHWKIRNKFQNKNLEPSKGIRGLMFSKKRNIVIDLKKESTAMIHMFFVFFPADIYWLDNKLNIVDYKKVYPFTIHKPKQKARYIVEISK